MSGVDVGEEGSLAISLFHVVVCSFFCFCFDRVVNSRAALK